ncbi:hypothetical protein CgunFtcFv8_005835 [Champsocephalus gunnari]|uniref:Uncharacterized protein n=1 Tax=Champsocephalus gunnari TaxID=52237 RepID=A0AAN8D296_CHAGU|nr:hypothetical protein CgunFtcFv8_005835 [Champsocephalus gunnari]
MTERRAREAREQPPARAEAQSAAIEREQEYRTKSATRPNDVRASAPGPQPKSRQRDTRVPAIPQSSPHGTKSASSQPRAIARTLRITPP